MALSKHAFFTQIISHLKDRFYETVSDTHGEGAALSAREEDGTTQPHSDGANSTRADPPSNSTCMMILFGSSDAVS